MEREELLSGAYDVSILSGTMGRGLASGGSYMKRVHGVMRSTKTLRSLVLLGGFLLCMSSHAQLIGVGSGPPVWPANPDLFSDGLTISYNASTLQFTVQGFTSGYYDPTGNADIEGGLYTGQPDYVLDDYSLCSSGTFTLSATVSHSGVYTPDSGTIQIGCASGVYDPNYDPTSLYPAGMLLQGNLTAFGFRGADRELNSTSHFDFEFTLTGGELASVFGGYGSMAGVAIDTQDYSFTGSFNVNFTSNGSGLADTLDPPTIVIIPEPSTWAMVALGIGVVLSGLRLRCRSS
jgi:hypothetical protein